MEIFLISKSPNKYVWVYRDWKKKCGSFPKSADTEHFLNVLVLLSSFSYISNSKSDYCLLSTHNGSNCTFVFTKCQDCTMHLALIINSAPHHFLHSHYWDKISIFSLEVLFCFIVGTQERHVIYIKLHFLEFHINEIIQYRLSFLTGL